MEISTSTSLPEGPGPGCPKLELQFPSPGALLAQSPTDGATGGGGGTGTCSHLASPYLPDPLRSEQKQLGCCHRVAANQ